MELPPLPDLLALLRANGVRRFSLDGLAVEFADGPPPTSARVVDSAGLAAPAPNIVDLVLDAPPSFAPDPPAPAAKGR